VAGSCDNSKKSSSSIKGEDVLDRLNDYQFLKTLLHGVYFIS
jgi:hypothetical protein